MPIYRVTAVETAEPQNGGSVRRRRRTFFVTEATYSAAVTRAAEDAVTQHKFSRPDILVEARQP